MKYPLALPIFLFALLFASSATTTTCHAFRSRISFPRRRIGSIRRPRLGSSLLSFPSENQTQIQKTLLNLSGGSLWNLHPPVSMSFPNSLLSIIQNGPYGVVGLALTSAAVLLPITQYKNLYAISVGYGLSIAAIGLCLLYTFFIGGAGANALSSISMNRVDLYVVAALIAYGFRLAGFLFLRDMTVVRTNSSRTSSVNQTPRLKRIPFALVIAFFYACLTTPVLYLLRRSPSTTIGLFVSTFGTALAWCGLVLESIADTHKYLVKRRSAKPEEKIFVGPTRGVYGWTRHPNYTGEVLFWCGILLAGAPTFQNSVIAWLCSFLGFAGIFNIMKSATRNLEKRQEETYAEQELYQKWKERVTVPLLPFLS